MTDRWCWLCEIEWHVLANRDPLAKVWERVEPEYCPKCGAKMRTPEKERR